MPARFCGGPLEDDRQSRVHSLIVHMRGDGYHSVGYYKQTENGVFEWCDDNIEPWREDSP